MPNRLSVIVVMSSLALTLGGCGGIKVTPKAEVRGNTVTVTAANTGQSVEIGRDQELVVRLPTEPRRGYRWIRDTPVVGLLAPVGAPAFQREALDTNVFEAAGFDVFRFRPSGPGRQTLGFEYRRPGELQAAPPQVVSYEIVVR